MPKAFISRAGDVDADVAQLATQLRAMGYQTWIDSTHLNDQASWQATLHAIAECDVFIGAISPASLDSISTRRQFDWATRLAKPVLGVVIRPPTKKLPRRFLRHPIIDYSHPPQRDQAAPVLHNALASLGPAPALPNPVPRPPAAPGSTGARKRIWLACAAAAVVVVAVIGIVLWLTVFLPASNAVKLTELKDGVFIGSSRASTTIDVFAEPICGPCAQFMTSSSGDLQHAVKDKTIAVRYHILNGEDDSSASGDYSTRAVAASLCVADTKDPDRFQAFYAALFASDFQPKKKPPASADRTNDELASKAQSVGAPASVSTCITSGQRMTAANDEASNAAAFLKGLEGTDLIPMVFEGKREVDYEPKGWLDNLRQS